MKDLIIFIFAFFLTALFYKLSINLYFYFFDNKTISQTVVQTVSIILLLNMISTVISKFSYNFLEKRIGK